MEKGLDNELRELLLVPEVVAKGSEDVLPSTRQELEIEELKEVVRGKRQDRRQRKQFAYCIFAFICVYMLVVLAIIALAGLSAWGFSLNEGTLITLLSTTTANVLGLFIIVAKYLFHAKDQ